MKKLAVFVILGLTIAGVSMLQAETAAQYASTIERSLRTDAGPIDIGDGLLLTDTVAEGNTLKLTIELPFPSSILKDDEKLRSRVLHSADQLQRRLPMDVCTVPDVQSFMELGGTMLYLYTFNDGERISSFVVTKKLCESAT